MCPPSLASPLTYLHTLAMTDLIYFPCCLAISRMSYKWNPSVCCLLNLASFTEHKSSMLLHIKEFVAFYCCGKKKSVSHSVMSDSFNPGDCSLPGSFVHGIPQTRILEWVAIPFSRGSSWPRDWTQGSYIAGRFFTVWATRIIFYFMDASEVVNWFTS